MPIPETLNHYRIVGPLGKGGMGEVYAADDTRLNRRIAVKVLSPLLASDPERRQRFEREAQAIAALNHPNIVTIHSVEEAGGVPFLTMELVEGRPLSEVVGTGGLPLEALLRVGLGVSDAMAAAHQRGITHRDLKPGNIMVLPDGRVKVLDFGLAKLREAQAEAQASAAADDVTRMPSGDLTGEGRIIGTVAYMSPEQAEGKPVDQRSDIFSLGVVLHEMATGEKPFKGDTTVSVISSILKDTPTAVTEIKPGLPDGLAKVIRRSLAKDPSRRYQTATDLRNELEELKQEVDSGIHLSTTGARSAVRPRPASRRSYVIAAIAAALLIAVGAGYVAWTNRTDRSGPAPLEIERPTRLTNSGNAALAAVSPDGRYVAHVKNDPGAPSLWMRQTATTSDVQIVPPAPVRYDGVTYSSDGDYVYYVTYELTGGIGTLYRIAALGGVPQKILEDVDSRIAFSPDRSQFTFVRGAPETGTAWVMIANADGSDVRQLAQLPRPDIFSLNAPAWSDDGRTIVAPAQTLRDGPHAFIAAIDVATGETTQVGGRWNFLIDLDWVPGTSSFLATGGADGVGSSQISQVAFPSGERRQITNDLNTYVSLSLSSDASSLATVQVETVANLWVSAVDDPAAGVQITQGRGRTDGQNGLDWTPDGRIVFSSGASGSPQIWMADPDGGNMRQLTNQAPVFSPAVSPDGQHIVFQRFVDGKMRIWRMAIDGSGQRPLTDGDLDLEPQPAPDGAVYFTRTVEGSPRPYKVPIEGGDAVALGQPNFRVRKVSPDGTRLLGLAWDTEARRSVLGLLPVSGGDVRLLRDIPSFAGTFHADGQSIVYPTTEKGTVRFNRYDLDTGTTRTFGSVKGSVFGGAASRDGERLVLSRGEVLSDVVLLTLRKASDE